MKKIICLLTCLLLALTACKKDETKKFVGTWKVASISVTYNNTPITINSAAQIDMLLHALKASEPEADFGDFSGECVFNSTLTIEKNGTFITEAGCEMPFLSSLEGTYTVNGDNISLKPSVEGLNLTDEEAAAAQINAVFNEDGQLVIGPGKQNSK